MLKLSLTATARVCLPKAVTAAARVCLPKAVTAAARVCLPKAVRRRWFHGRPDRRHAARQRPSAEARRRLMEQHKEEKIKIETNVPQDLTLMQQRVRGRHTLCTFSELASVLGNLQESRYEKDRSPQALSNGSIPLWTTYAKAMPFPIGKAHERCARKPRCSYVSFLFEKLCEWNTLID